MLRILFLVVLVAAGLLVYAVLPPWLLDAPAWLSTVPVSVWKLAGTTCTVWLSLRAVQAISLH